MTISEASNYQSFVGGYSDRRLPTIKELYTLSDFNDQTETSADDSIPFIDELFEITYGTDRSVDGNICPSNSTFQPALTKPLVIMD